MRNVWWVRRPNTKATISPVIASSTHHSQRCRCLLPTNDQDSSTFKLRIRLLPTYLGLTGRTSLLFFKMAADRIPIDTQHTSGIAYPTPVESKLGNLGFDQRITRLMGVCFDEPVRRCGSATIEAPIPLRTATGGAVAFDLLSLTTMFASNCF